MKKACLYLSFDTYASNNKIFEGEQSFYPLKEQFTNKGYDLATQDINKPEESEIIIYFSLPHQLPVKNHPNSYLWRFESEVISPNEWKEENLVEFKKVFTWHDDLVKNNPEKYIKFNFPQAIPTNIKMGIEHKDKFCTLIAGNKFSRHPLEIYSKRIEAIKWFEKYHPEDFDLYGVDWERGIQKVVPKIFQRFTQSKYLRNFFVDYCPSYKGTIVSKRETLEKYKYSICYENAKDITGYITEKIFDCFFAGCIPVYWGANNIMEHIPAECFIDKRDFKSYEDLYDFLLKMKDEQYLEYQKNIEEFVYGEKINPFLFESFVTVNIDTIFNTLPKI